MMLYEILYVATVPSNVVSLRRRSQDVPDYVRTLEHYSQLVMRFVKGQLVEQPMRATTMY